MVKLGLESLGLILLKLLFYQSLGALIKMNPLTVLVFAILLGSLCNTSYFLF